MQEQAGIPGEPMAEATARFVVIIQGRSPMACVVEGLGGVREVLLRSLWQEPGGAVLDEMAAALATLEDAQSWAVHGGGDGRPFWHWWFGYEGGSVTVQRLTEDRPPDAPGAERLRAALAEALATLSDCARLLRGQGGAEAGGYLFASRHSAGQQG